jgi:hypothetical protein
MGQYVVIQGARAGNIAVWPAQHVAFSYQKAQTVAFLATDDEHCISIEQAAGGSLFIAENLQAAITHATLLRKLE